ncbi:hypothetical protein T05_1463 [Trichinella murrelli]|uniref:Uncharacterized protein n=1 Tax=Trichinella murrelli TaxID=144512 RepID=A0A0V0TCT6_9BILA|nr:hypothetical protein T05_1463 [Trichinella murrelli]
MSLMYTRGLPHRKWGWGPERYIAHGTTTSRSHLSPLSWRTLTVPDWIITPFDIETENANIEFSVQDEPVEINVDLDA